MQWLFLYAGSVWALVALGLLFVAWRAARNGHIDRHRKIMIFLTVAAWFFILLYLLRYRYPGLVPEVPKEFIPWVAFHGTVALFPLLGAPLLVFARLKQRKNPQSRSHFNKHHRIYGGVLMLLWAFTHVGGIVNAVLFG